MVAFVTRRWLIAAILGAIASSSKTTCAAAPSDAIFRTRAEAEASAISAQVHELRTKAFSRSGDSGGAHYVRVPEQPAHAGKFRSRDRFLPNGAIDAARGGWWELTEDRPGPQHFGALSGADATRGWQDAINYAAATGRAIYPIDGVYMLAGARGPFRSIITIPTGVDITIRGSGRGCRLKLPDGYSEHGDYRMMVSADKKPMGNIAISGLAFDGNGSKNLVRDSHENIRSGYCMLLYCGNTADLHDLWFENIAGRSAVVLGNNSNQPDWNSVRLTNNRIEDVGGAIPGNEAQNDHSSFFVQAASAEISGNVFSNSDPDFDPQASPHRACTALEIHCVNAVIENNIMTNYGTAGMAVSIKYPVTKQVWKNNKFLRCKSNAFKTFTMKEIGHVIISGNQIQIDNLRSPGGGGIFQDPSRSETAATVGSFEITDNVITCMRTTPASYVTHGVLLCAFESMLFLRNQLSYWQGDGLRIEDHEGALDVANARIDQCQFHNCGMQTGAASPFAIYILNRDRRKIFSGITIGAQNRIWQDSRPAGAPPPTGRGIRIRGPGSFRHVVVQMPQTLNIAEGLKMSVMETDKAHIRIM